MSFGKRHYVAAPYAQSEAQPVATGAAHEIGAAFGRLIGLAVILATICGVVWVVASGAWLTVAIAAPIFALIMFAVRVISGGNTKAN